MNKFLSYQYSRLYPVVFYDSECITDTSDKLIVTVSCKSRCIQWLDCV
jgi:hypothetical protein